nr:MAG TPA: hypothetical protein [Caudoviricetes sp.]
MPCTSRLTGWKMVLNQCSPLRSPVLPMSVQVLLVQTFPSRLVVMQPWLLRINCCENRMSSCKVK